MSSHKDKGYNQAIYLLRELDFDPVFDFFVIIPLHCRVFQAFKLPDQVDECVKSGIIDIRKAKKSKSLSVPSIAFIDVDASNKSHIEMKCRLYLMVKGTPAYIPIYIWLKEKDYPVSMSPIIMVDSPQGILLFSVAIPRQLHVQS